MQGATSRGKKHAGRREAAWMGVLRTAIQAHQGGDLASAERLYRRVFALRPGQPDALHFHGVLCHQQGRSDAAVASIERALKQIPGHPDAHNNLGNVHKECGRLAEAEACYRRALACAPGHANALSNLAVVLEAGERPDDAFDTYTRLLEQVPDYAHGHYLFGLFLRNHAQHAGHIEDSATHFHRAWELDPRNLRALEAQGVSLYTLGRHDEAAAVYRDWLQREPGNPVARHMLAACGASEAPSRCADDYVRTVFDGFAESFDEQLLNNLGYRAPQAMMAALATELEAQQALDVLDAGCGTGLCAPLLRPHARHLEGVDLSPGMIAKARQRGGYDHLEVAELTAFMAARAERYDLIASADTLVYFGALEDVSAAALQALRPGGRLAFTVEVLDGDPDRTQLGESGRYRHGRAYLERVLAASGFDDITLRAEVLRQEAGRPVRGWVVLARRPRGAG